MAWLPGWFHGDFMVEYRNIHNPDSPFLASHAQKAAFVWPSSCEVQPTMHLVLAARVSFSAFLQEVAPSHLIGEKSNVALTTKK